MKKRGEGLPGKPPLSPRLCASAAAPSPILRTHFQVPYPASPLFATLTKTAGVCTNNSRFGAPLSPPFQKSHGLLATSRIPPVTNHESPVTSHGLLLHCSTHGSPTPRPTLPRRSSLARRNRARHSRLPAFYCPASQGRQTLLDRNWPRAR